MQQVQTDLGKFRKLEICSQRQRTSLPVLLQCGVCVCVGVAYPLDGGLTLVLAWLMFGGLWGGGGVIDVFKCIEVNKHFPCCHSCNTNPKVALCTRALLKACLHR